MHRIFIVGYPRSGTTLLQSLIGSHCALTTFTESSLFIRALRPWRYYRPLHLRRDPIGLAAEEFLRENRLDHLVYLEALKELKKLDKKRWVKGIDVAGAIVNLIDQIGLSRHKSGWLEKSPRHLYYCALISESAPNAQFIHIARDGREAVASYVVAAPSWVSGPKSVTPASSARLWNAEIKRSLRYAKHPMHHFVTYEGLVQRLENETDSLVEQLGLSHDSGLLSRYQDTAKLAVRPDETWKSMNVQKIQQQSTFKQVLSAKDRDKVEQILNPGLYEQFKRVIQIKRGGLR